MKQEDKQLLLKDLCGRFPYGTIVYAQNSIDWFECELCTQIISDLINEDYIIKPYLLPLTSMSEKQKREYNMSFGKDEDILRESVENNLYDKMGISLPLYNHIDWLNKNHFDYRGLIDKGLAIDSTNLNIY